MKKESRSGAAPVSVPTTLAWAGRIGARCGLLNGQFTKKFFQPRRFQTWYQPDRRSFTRVSQTGNALYHNLVDRYQPPALRIQRRFDAAAKTKNWQPLDLALPGQVNATPAPAPQPDLASLLMGTPMEKPSTASFSAPKPPAPVPASAGQIIPRKENDPDFAPNRSGGKRPAPPARAPRLSPNQRLFTHVEEVLPGKETAPIEAAPKESFPGEPAPREAAPTIEPLEKAQPSKAQPSKAPSEAVQPVRRAQPRPKPISPAPANVQREMATPASPQRDQDTPPVQPLAAAPAVKDGEKPLEAVRPVVTDPLRPPVQQKAAIVARAHVEKELKKIAQPAHDRPVTIPARPATLRPENPPPAPRVITAAMPAGKPARRAPEKAAMAPAPAQFAAATRTQPGLVQREFTPGVRPLFRKPRPRFSLGSQRTLSPLARPTKPANAPRLGMQRLLPLSPARRSPSARPSGSAPARDPSVYLASPEPTSTPAAPLQPSHASMPSAYQSFPDQPAPLVRPRPIPPARNPSVYLASPDRSPAAVGSPKRPASTPSAYASFPDLPAPTAPSKPKPQNPHPASTSSIYAALAGQHSTGPAQSQPRSTVSAPSAYGAFGDLPMPMANPAHDPEPSHAPAGTNPHWASGGYTDGKDEPAEPVLDPESGVYTVGSSAATEESPQSSGDYQPGQSEPSQAAQQQSNYYAGGGNSPSAPASPDTRPPVYLSTSWPEPESSPEPAADEQPSTALSEPSSVPQSQPAPSASASSRAEDAQPESPDFERIARQVYPIILRKLRVERERQAGHLR